jgi:hypothetical protein
MWRKIAIIIIITSVIFSISDYFYTMRESYNKYLEGEYYFRYEATTVPVMDQDAWFESVENFEKVSSLDFSDTKIMLLYGGEQEVYASGPHDGVCTVIYGSQTVDDFPVYNLRFEGDDADYFFGRKQLTYEEYIDYVKSLSPEELKSDRVSTQKMASFKTVLEFTFILVGTEALICLILFILHRSDAKLWFDIVLVLGTLYCIFFEVITAVLN